MNADESDLRPANPHRAGRFSVVCLSSQPWEVDLPTNRQQLMRRVALRGHEVLFVDTGAHFGRAIRAALLGHGRLSALRRVLRGTTVERGVRSVVAPNLLPWGHRFALAARINARLTALQIRRATKEWPPVVLWLYDPCFADCIGASGEQFAVYDCVDDYAEQVGDDLRKRALVASYDRCAASRARIVFATATSLRDRHAAVNANTHLVPNVGDYAHFAPAIDAGIVPPGLRKFDETVIGFAGNFLESKVDFRLLEGLARARPEWTLLLVGPVRPETAAALSSLLEAPNVRWTGPVPYADLPRYVAAFDVGLIPYVENDYTRSCFPLKLYEYLAAGKPVVATGLPQLRSVGPLVPVCDGLDETVAAIESGLRERTPEAVAARQTLARANTWDSRVDRLLGLIEEQFASLEGQAG